MLLGFWVYEQENGVLFCKCQDCNNRLPLGRSLEGNPHHFCSVCGRRLYEGRFAIEHEKVYGNRHIEGTKPIGWSSVPMTAENE